MQWGQIEVAWAVLILAILNFGVLGLAIKCCFIIVLGCN